MIRLYSHGGSGNHGCEALVRSTAHILKNKIGGDAPVLYTYALSEDQRYIPSTTFRNLVELKYENGNITYYLHALAYKLGDKNAFTRIRHSRLIADVNKGDICLCMGGDTYTYDGWPELMAYVNCRLRKKGARTVLWGCSLSEDLFKNSFFIEDMKAFDLITVREKVTADMLAKNGIRDNVVLVTDPAFQLPVTDYDLSSIFGNKKDIVGINLSPLILSCESSAGITLENYRNLVEYILQNTDFNIALVPHVVWGGNDDRVAIEKIKNMFSTDRVKIVPDMDCCSLKGAISHCRLFIGARTHSTIAAYSTLVPTLVVGYSVKATGIARDIFGSDKHYVIPVQSLCEPTQLMQEFIWLLENEENTRERLEKTMPDYKENCFAGIDRLKTLL